MDEIFSRVETLLGKDKVDILKSSRVAIFGIGGVGSHAAEALARCGVGELHLYDHDMIAASNINRQLHATTKTVGEYKVMEMQRRLTDINPEINIKSSQMFVMPDNIGLIDFDSLSYVIDAVDTVTAKLAIIEASQKSGVPVISSMGTGNKLRPDMLEITDISKTHTCPLARVLRYELKKRNITSLKVCFSKEKPMIKSRPPGSSSFVPPAAGLLIASEAVCDLLSM